MNQLVAVDQNLPALFAADMDSVKKYVAAAHSPATIRAYKADWSTFLGYCSERGLEALPASAEVIAAFLSSQSDAGVKVSTLSRRLAAIKFAHEVADLHAPTSSKTVKTVMQGIKREKGVAKAQKAPATNERIATMLESCPDTLIGLRDRAVLALGFAGAFRRSELVALNVEDLEVTDAGLRVHIRRSKTDQEGAGHVVAVPNGGKLGVVSAVVAWLDAAGIEEGPIFRSISKGGKVSEASLSDKSVANIVKDYAEKAGLDPKEFAGHSLRAGFLTSAALAGADIFKMMEVSRHKHIEVLRVYVREADLFRNHAGAGFL